LTHQRAADYVQGAWGYWKWLQPHAMGWTLGGIDTLNPFVVRARVAADYGASGALQPGARGIRRDQ
jgi:hypothetical protein